MIRLALILIALAVPAQAVETVQAAGAVVRSLDKISGEVADIELVPGFAGGYGRLTIEIQECRVPRANPSGDAFAFVNIHHEGQDAPLFSGWMIASSPAINAFDHHRYDVWLLRCTTS